MKPRSLLCLLNKIYKDLRQAKTRHVIGGMDTYHRLFHTVS